MKKLDQKLCMITGATGGLGSAAAKLFSEEGASLILIGRSIDKLKTIKAALTPCLMPGQTVLTQTCDFKNPQDFEKLEVLLKSQEEPIAVMVHAAGIQGPIGAIEMNDWKAWEETIKINFMIPARLSALTLPRMKKKHSGKIIFVAGGGAVKARPNFTAYACSKVSVARLAETLAQETAAFGIDVNVISPGIMNTPMVNEMIASGVKMMEKEEYEKVMKVLNSPSDSRDQAARLILFLASSESDGITGRFLSAPWDPWQDLLELRKLLTDPEAFKLRRVLPNLAEPEPKRPGWKG